MITRMLKVSTNLFRWILLAAFVCCAFCQSVWPTFENKTGSTDGKPRIFFPRMDYDEWTPLGRGDPLKNNPTFDYVPPVLDRVQYWLDSHTTEPSAKRDILVLGVTAKKTSPKIPEQFLKFVDGPKFTRTSQEVPYRNDFTGSTGAEPPKVVRNTSFRNGLVDYRNQNRIQSLPASYYPSPYYNQKSKPYTMMMPPPVSQKAEPPTNFNTAATKDRTPGYESQQFSTQTEEGPLQDSSFYALSSKNHQSSSPTRQSLQSSKSPMTDISSQVDIIKSIYTSPSSVKSNNKYEATTSPSVSFEKSNLIYHSTQTLSGGWTGNNGPTSSSSSSTVSGVNQATWQTSDYSRDHYEIDHQAAASSNQEVIVGQNANITVDGDSSGNEEVVIGQKEVSASGPSSGPNEASFGGVQFSSTTESAMNEKDGNATDDGKKMHIVIANSGSNPFDRDNHEVRKGPVAIVIPTNYDKRDPTSSLRPETFTVIVNASEHVTTEKPMAHPQTLKPQGLRKSATSPLTITKMEDSVPSSLPNKMFPPHQLPHPPSPSLSPERHLGGPSHMFAPQLPPQSMMHLQAKPNHGMMHFIGSMRPGVGFRPSHMSPPMAHMHAPPPMRHLPEVPVSLDHVHRRPQQAYQTVFASSSTTPTPTSMRDETHESRIRETTALTTTPPLTKETVPSKTTQQTTVDGQEQPKLEQSTLQKILADEEEEKKKKLVTTASPQVTTMSSLTTDPIFSHYKQPVKPIRGPMYLIIQGHSKVKTYKPTVTKHRNLLENNEILENTTEQMSKFEQFIKENTKGGNAAADRKKQQQQQQQHLEAKNREKQSGQNSLMSLVESGLRGLILSPSSSATMEEERQPNSVTTIEIGGN